MHRITLLLILFLLIPDVYIYFVYIVRKTKNTPTLLLLATNSFISSRLYLSYVSDW